ncbi:MAG: peptide deformylase, partial [Cephaloticoccus sp.]
VTPFPGPGPRQQISTDGGAEPLWSRDGRELFYQNGTALMAVTVTPGTDDYIYEEGCLSFPEIRGDVIRPDAITVKFQDQHGVPHELACDGLLSRCIQHEVDHLAGTLFIDRMEKRVRTKLDKAVKELALATKAAAGS